MCAPLSALAFPFLSSFYWCFNPVTSAPRAGEVSRRLSHGLRANLTPQALPEGRPSVRSVCECVRGWSVSCMTKLNVPTQPSSAEKAKRSPKHLFKTQKQTHTHIHSHTHSLCPNTNRQMTPHCGQISVSLSCQQFAIDLFQTNTSRSERLPSFPCLLLLSSLWKESSWRSASPQRSSPHKPWPLLPMTINHPGCRLPRNNTFSKRLKINTRQIRKHRHSSLGKTTTNILLWIWICRDHVTNFFLSPSAHAAAPIPKRSPYSSFFPSSPPPPQTDVP